MRGHSKQMTIGQLIETLERKDETLDVTFDFVHFRPTGKGHSYRGYYEDFALAYESGGSFGSCSVFTLVQYLKSVLGETFTGYKGGDYTMSDDTVVWVANRSESGGTAIVDVVDDDWRVILKTMMVD